MAKKLCHWQWVDLIFCLLMMWGVIYPYSLRSGYIWDNGGKREFTERCTSGEGVGKWAFESRISTCENPTRKSLTNYQVSRIALILSKGLKLKIILNHVLFLYRNCRNCNRRLSLPHSPSLKSEHAPIPVASSTPNNAESTPRSKSSLPNSYHSPGTPKSKNFILAAGNSGSEHGLNGKYQLFSTPAQVGRGKTDSPQTPGSTSKENHKASSAITSASRSLPSSTYGKASPSTSERSDSSLDLSEPKSDPIVQLNVNSPVSKERPEESTSNSN